MQQLIKCFFLFVTFYHHIYIRMNTIHYNTIIFREIKHIKVNLLIKMRQGFCEVRP